MSERWSLRKSDGATFGPVDLATLIHWSKDGRIAPDDQVAPEGGAWTPAVAHPELGMDWIVQLATGELFGPVHLHAMREPWQADQIAPRTKLVRRSTGESFDAADLLVRVLLEREAESAQRIDELEARARALAETAARAPDPTMQEKEIQARVARQWKDLESTKDLLQREVQRVTRLHEDERAAHLKVEASLAALQKAQREEQLATRRQVEDLQKRLRLAESAVPSTPAAGATSDKPDLQDMVRRLTRNYHTMTEQAERNAEDLRQARERIAELERLMQDGPGELERQLAAARVEIATANAARAELEETHRDVLRQFRDLNDRHLRAVQNLPPNPAP